MPISDWNANKKQGEVKEIYAKEIGRKVFSIGGSVSPHNFVMIPNPHSISRNLGLVGRYLYIMVKCQDTSSPMGFHVDLKMNESKSVTRLSAS